VTVVTYLVLGTSALLSSASDSFSDFSTLSFFFTGWGYRPPCLVPNLDDRALISGCTGGGHHTPSLLITLCPTPLLRPLWLDASTNSFIAGNNPSRWDCQPICTNVSTAYDDVRTRRIAHVGQQIWKLRIEVYSPVSTVQTSPLRFIRTARLLGLFFLFVKNSYTKFYENPTEIVVADTGSQTDGRVWVFTQGRLFLYVLKYD
jgi:hypothetical protein